MTLKQAIKDPLFLCRYRGADGECGTPIILDAESPSGFSHAEGRDWCHWAAPMAYGPQDSRAAFMKKALVEGLKVEEGRCTCVVMTPRNIYPGGRHLDDSCPVTHSRGGGRVSGWGECPICGMCSTIGHEWWCARNPNQVPCPPKLGAGELDGQCLIEMNNVAVGFVWPSNDSSGICWSGRAAQEPK